MPPLKPTPPPPSIWERLGDVWGALDGWLQGIILLGAAVGVVVTFLRYVRPRVDNVRSDARAIRDTLVGRPATYDSITKRQTSPALPSIGERMAAQEEATNKAAAALAKMAADSHRLTEVERRVTRIEDVLSIDKRLEKIEAVQLLRTIETVAQADPPDDEPSTPRPD